MGVHSIHNGSRTFINCTVSGMYTERLDKIQLKPTIRRTCNERKTGKKSNVQCNRPASKKRRGNKKSEPMVCCMTLARTRFSGRTSRGKITRLTRLALFLMTTTIQIKEDVRDRLNDMKLHPRESYNDVIERLFEDFEELSEETLKDIEEAVREIESGKYKTQEEVEKELGFK